MSTGVIIQLAVLACFLVAALFVARRGPKQSEAEALRLEGAWEDALGAENSSVGRGLLKMSKPLAGLPGQAIKPTSNTYQQLQEKLMATGSKLYGGSVEVFLSFQVLMFLIGAMAATAVLVFSRDKMILGGTAVFVAALALWPYNRVSDLAKKRQVAVMESLPAFAELLVIPIAAGKSIIPALKFTADKIDGVVSEEVKAMIVLIESRAVSEEDAFAIAGRRLGGQAAPVFMNSLYEAHARGVAISEALTDQAKQLRFEDYQRRRELMKKLPNKMVFIIALHLLPFLFVITLLPTFFALGNM